jgi:hypothetical protein
MVPIMRVEQSCGLWYAMLQEPSERCLPSVPIETSNRACAEDPQKALAFIFGKSSVNEVDISTGVLGAIRIDPVTCVGGVFSLSG